MSFLNLDNYQRQDSNISHKLRGLLPQLDRYFETELDQKRATGSKQSKDYLPVTLAKRLEVGEGVVLALLMVYENAGVVKPDYQVLCPDSDSFLGSFKSPEELPETIHCPYHEREKEHDKIEYHVDLVFRLTPQAIENYIRNNQD